VADGVCPGACNVGYRKAREAYDAALAAYDPLDAAQSRPEPPGITPWLGQPFWCGRCHATIRQQLDELDEAASLLIAAADGHSPSSGEQRVSGSQEPPSPSPAGDDLDELVKMITGWEQSYRSLKGWPAAPRRGYLASVVTGCAAWLMHHLDGILSAEDIAGDFGEEIMQWHREFTAKAKAGARRLPKPLRCPGCKLLMLFWTEGEKDVRCANRDCGRVMTLAEYEAEVDRKAGESPAAA
jgi:hypothetical protein